MYGLWCSSVLVWRLLVGVLFCGRTGSIALSVCFGLVSQLPFRTWLIPRCTPPLSFFVLSIIPKTVCCLSNCLRRLYEISILPSDMQTKAACERERKEERKWLTG
mmetsp:Transcript_17978/g.36510  ORF Transcript_17978/g.36510 Transcript_17978/m.36510 type:complete len:105 (+) Transcript_17978:279-593(+)